MNKNYKQFKFPIIRCYTWKEVFKQKKVKKIFFELLSLLLKYSPWERLSAAQALKHSFFDEIRDFKALNANGIRKDVIKMLFEFSEEEIEIDEQNI
jgi:glycogen synthase kinase 3 beta